MKKLIFRLLAVLTAAFVSVTAAGCFGGNGGGDSENVLDIYLLYKGYGDEWLQDAMKRFAEDEEVKSLYPNLKINYTSNSEDAHAPQKLNAGASINQYDLMFGVDLQGYETQGLIADLTDIVYNAEVPGESGVKVKDKIPDDVLERVRRAQGAPVREDGGDSYYVVSYIDGMFGMMYNADLLDQMELEVPLTTEQFKKTGDEIKAKKYTSSLGENEDTVIINNASDDYWNSSYTVWWAQYEGLQNVEDYFEGYDRAEDVVGSMTVLDQHGRLEALRTVEDILENYSYSLSQSVLDYKEAQTAFLSGRGVFHYNGDYFSTEMAIEYESLKSDGVEYDIKFMKMPVISAIVEKLDFYTHGDAEFEMLSQAEKDAYDAKLQTIIKDVDGNLTYDESVSKQQGISGDDFETVAAARCIAGLRSATSQVAVIPSYAAAKDLAAYFLRYMYKEESIRQFAISSKGIIFPTSYDVLNDEEVNAASTPLNKSKMELLRGTSNYSFTALPAESATTLGRGGLTAIYFNGKFEVMFRQTGENRMSAEDIIAAEKAHWQGGWEQMLSAAGLTNN